MRKMSKHLALVLFTMLLGISGVLAQKRTLTGTVTDDTGKPVPSATISVKGTTVSTVSDDNGKYSIAIDKEGAVLVISSIGFATKEIAVGTSSELVAVLSAVAGETDVVVTALGIKRQKKSLGYAVQEIKGSVLSDAKETNLANAFSGKVAGLQVVRSSNGAGGSSKIVLRGFTSLTGNNQPLIVVDGIPMDNFTGTTENGYWGAGLDRGNGLGDISADDIESMSVLKGPSAAALYGTRAGNGVILITTKSGRKQPGLGLSLSATYGSEDIFLKPELQNSFGQGRNNIYNPQNLSDNTSSWGPKITGQTITKWDGSQGVMAAQDNVENFLRNGTNQNYTLGLQQQFGSTAVYSSLSYLDNKSIIPGNKLTRTNFTTRATTKFGKNNRWTSDVKMSYNNTAGYNRPINGRDNSSVFVLYMLPRSLDIRDFSAATNQFGGMLWYPGAPGSQSNPYWLQKYNLNQDTRNRFLFNGSLKYAITDWLDAEVKAGGDIYTTSTDQRTYTGGPLSNSYGMGKQTFTETNYSALLTAKKDNIIGKFGATATAGGNLMSQKFSSLNASANPLSVPNLFSPNNTASRPGVFPGYSTKKINSVFGSVGVNYDGYVYLDVTYRNDWTSALAKSNRSFSYPSFSLSYVVTDMIENMGGRLPSWISYGKLRASHASVGNDLGPYQLYNGYLISTDPLGTTVASRQTVKYDANVRSELIKNLEFGAEIRLFKNRLGIDFTWYKSNATNQLINIPMDPLSGYASRKANAGDIQNKGIELMADVRILTNPKSLNWNLTANFSKNENKIIDLASNEGVNVYPLGEWDNVFIRAATGELYGDIYGSQFRRVRDQSSPYFGQLILSASGLPQIEEGGSVKLGNQQAKGLLGVTNSFSYKNIGFSFLVDARFGGQIFSASNVGLQSAGTAAITAPGGERPDFVVDGVILGANGAPQKNTISVSQQSYWGAVSTTGNLGISEAYIYDASNIRLRNVMVSYELPRSLFGGKVFQKARLSASCNNVWMIKHHLNGIDPESVFATGSNAVGFENGGFPTMRSFLFSLNLGF